MPTVAGASAVRPVGDIARFYKILINQEGIDVAALQSADEVAAISIKDPELIAIAKKASDVQAISRNRFYNKVLAFIKQNNDMEENYRSWDGGVF